MTTTRPAQSDRTTVVLPQPQLIGVNTVSVALGVQRWRVYELIRERSPRVMPGYLGKVARRHTWNAHELFASMFTSSMALVDEIARVEAGIRADGECSVDGCGRNIQFLGLCFEHVRQLHRVFRNAEHSDVAVWRLLAMCTWVVERNRHLVPPQGWDPWSGICMTPGCDNRTDGPRNRSSPLCPECSDRFWGCRTS